MVQYSYRILLTLYQPNLKKTLCTNSKFVCMNGQDLVLLSLLYILLDKNLASTPAQNVEFVKKQPILSHVVTFGKFIPK
jgi:hypothetical protein